MQRWELERGNRVYQRAGRSPGARRRGERLLVAARRGKRTEMGISDSGVSEVVTPGIVRRWIGREEGAGNAFGWALAVVVTAVVAVVLAGVGLLLGYLAYLAWWFFSPRIGAVRWQVFGIISVIAAAGCALFLVATPHETLGELVVAFWRCAQAVIAPTYATWLTIAWGWPAVTAKAETSSRVKPIRIDRTLDSQGETSASDATHERSVIEDTGDSDGESPVIKPIVIDSKESTNHD